MNFQRPSVARAVQTQTGHQFPFISRFPGLSQLFGISVPVTDATVTAAEQKALVEEATVAALEDLPAEEKEQWDEQEKILKEDIATYTTKKPQHVSGYTSWDGKRCVVWYYIVEDLYGVEVTFNANLTTGPKFQTLAEAQTYAQQATQV